MLLSLNKTTNFFNPLLRHVYSLKLSQLNFSESISAVKMVNIAILSIMYLASCMQLQYGQVVTIRLAISTIPVAVKLE